MSKLNLEALLVEMNKQLADYPAGSPGRIARANEIGRERLGSAQSESERRFWRAFLKATSGQPKEMVRR